MSTNSHHDLSGTDRRRSSGVRHSKEGALTPTEFEALVEATYQLKSDHDIEARLILFLAGRLGLRRGEIAHMEGDWIDWRQERIEIPGYEPCDRGRNGGPCGMCRQYAQQMAEHNDNLSMEEALRIRAWSPKTENAARSVPFGWSPRSRRILERYFDEYPRWMYSSSVVGRRIDWLVERAEEVDHCHPHALRATAASHHAGRGLDRFNLCALLGWSQLQTAECYVRASADNLDHTLRHAHR